MSTSYSCLRSPTSLRVRTIFVLDRDDGTVPRLAARKHCDIIVPARNLPSITITSSSKVVRFLSRQRIIIIFFFLPARNIITMLKVYNKLNRNQLKALEEYRTVRKTRRYVLLCFSTFLTLLTRFQLSDGYPMKKAVRHGCTILLNIIYSFLFTFFECEFDSRFKCYNRRGRVKK